MKLLGILVLVEGIHHQVVNSLKLLLILNDAQDAFPVLLHGLEDAHFQVKLFKTLTGGHHRQVGFAVVVQGGQDLQLLFIAVIVHDGDEIGTVLIGHDLSSCVFLYLTVFWG